jgi:hypothetical protein
MQPSKSVSWIESTREPLAMGCTSCASDILSAGRKTMDGIPAAAQYAERAAEVSPVDAHPTAETAEGSRFRMRFTWETRAVIPRSLKDPVWLFPHCFTHRSCIPSLSFPKRSAQNRFEFPSNMDTTSSLEMPGFTHSFLDHTPEPKGKSVPPARSSKRAFQYFAS